MHTAWKMNRVILFLVALTCCGFLQSDRARAEGWRAGVARVKITPPQLMWMAGYAARTHAADGSYADLWAKTLVLEDATGQRGVLISLDLVGMDRTLSQSICRALDERYELQRSQIAICFTHTHSGPVVGKNLEPLHYRQLDQQQQLLIDRYASQLQQHVIECVAAAIQGLRPCQLTWASGVATFAVNRRNNPAQDVPQLRADHALRGPVDHDVPVLAVRGEQGQLQAVVFGYACHATVLSDYKWSGDYPGFAAQEIESRQAGCTALFWAGCGADQNPLPRRDLELARQYGRQLADTVSQVLAGDMQKIAGPLNTAYREIPLTLAQLPTEQELRKDAASDNPYTPLVPRCCWNNSRRAALYHRLTLIPSRCGDWAKRSSSCSWVAR